MFTRCGPTRPPAPGERLDGCEGGRDHGTVGWWPDDRSAGDKGDRPRARMRGAAKRAQVRLPKLAVHVRARAGQVLLQERTRLPWRGGNGQEMELAHVVEQFPD